MKHALLKLLAAAAIIICAGLAGLRAQQSLDATLTVKGEERNYSLYIPSTYNSATPNSLMLAFHPLNVARWNSRTWRDTLTDFAEANGLILLCPDGGTGGNSIDQEIDTLLATALLDAIPQEYNVDKGRVYTMGFSVGSVAAYIYGLSNPERFGGYLITGAAVNGTSEIEALLPNVAGKPIYVVHGSTDSPKTRFTPVVAALEQNGAILQSLLMSGVGHTFDFPNRNTIITTAFQWIDSVNRANLPSGVRDEKGKGNRMEDGMGSTSSVRFYPNPILREGEGMLQLQEGRRVESVQVIDIAGNIREDAGVTFPDRSSAKIIPSNLQPGVYFLEVSDQNSRHTIPFVVQ